MKFALCFVILLDLQVNEILHAQSADQKEQQYKQQSAPKRFEKVHNLILFKQSLKLLAGG
jgi:hypothetical protein